MNEQVKAAEDAGRQCELCVEERRREGSQAYCTYHANVLVAALRAYVKRLEEDARL